MHNVSKRLFFIACVLLMCLPGFARAQTSIVITPDKAGSGDIPLQFSYFEDQTGTDSLPQAQAQFSRLEKSGELRPASLLNFSKEGGTYWVNVTVTNNTNFDKWMLDFMPVEADLPSLIKSLALYDPASGGQSALATWPIAGQKASAALPLTIKPGETQTRYVLVQTWPGMSVAIEPVLKTQQYALQQEIDTSEKTSLSWLILGVVFGAGLVQLILTRQSVQAVLALNALLVGLGIFVLHRPELFIDIKAGHPLLLPLHVACICSIGAALMLWAACGWKNKKASWCLLPMLLNIAIILVAVFKMDVIFMLPFGIENLPLYIISMNGILLTVFTLLIGLEKLSLYYYIPAWLLLALMPFMIGFFPVAAPVLYVVLLGLAGILSVFSHWQAMDKETENLQRRLRLELKNIKDKYREENENWNLKMENQRNILNELREREQQRSAELETARKEADAANRAKSDFLAIISHEIRTPMNGIMGIVQIINETPMDDRQRDYIDVIKNSGETMLTLLNDILDYSKIEKGAIEIEDIPFSLRKLIQSVATLMSGRAQDKGLAIIVDIAPELPDNLSGDPNRIRQILLNLISNAIKFTETGSVTLRVNAKTKDMVLFEIVDTGIGISPMAQKRLFQAYVQADASISRRFGGTGLGLNICRMLVNAMHGTIGVKSAESHGSNFWFEIPLSVSSVAAPYEIKQPAIAEEKPVQKMHILVIDDNSVNLKVVRGLLEMDGHDVMTADGGETALRLIQQQDFNLVFVDMMMPGMSGKAFLEKLRQNPDRMRAELPVFALTGLADAQTKKDILESGMLGIVVKPVTKDALRDAVRQAGAQQGKHDKVSIILAEYERLSPEQKDQLLQVLAPNAGEEKSLKTEIAMLNMTMLSELKESLPVETLTEIFDELIQKAKDLTDEIEKANDDHDFKALGEKAHNIRGMAGNFGLQGLMEHSAGIETAVRSGENDKAASLAKSSRAVLEQSLTALDAWLKS